METMRLKDFLEIPYTELEELNLAAKGQRIERADRETVAAERRKYLAEEKRIKAVTVCFSDIEGRLHMLDYDKKHLLRSADNLTFDGSSIRGFSVQQQSDLKLVIDWPAFYWLPADIFGPGKVLVFAEVRDRDGSAYAADFRARLQACCDQLYEKDGTVAEVAPEIEGFLFRGTDAERHYYETGAFEFISTGGYFHSLPQDPLRRFMDYAAEAQRAMGFGNEKDHPEVAPSQFEMNFGYVAAPIAADQILLYKLLCRQVAQRLEMTASFLPKPVAGVNGCGMHANISLRRGDANLFYDGEGRDGLSALGWDFIERLLYNAGDICLLLNSSVNAYRRLDPHFEAPNEVKASAVNRAAMIRIPLANQRSARIEVRSVAPDANPYLAVYALLRTGLEGPRPEQVDRTIVGPRYLPAHIHEALRVFERSAVVAQLLGEDVQKRLANVKRSSANRCPRELGTRVKREEVMFHHEVTNQFLWSLF